MEIKQRLFDVIKKSLWNMGTAMADWEIYEEMKLHAIAPLAAPVLSELNLPDELFKKWKMTCLHTIANYQYYMYAQKTLPITVPYVILKGTSAAQYYPYPEYRMMGDIDLMTSHEDYDAACDMLLQSDFKENTNAVDRYLNRHREFIRNRAYIEIHSYYALRDKREEVKALDDLIISGIGPTHVLPDMVNGLTLIEHINHHIEEGLGLRQIIDWMMFVDHCLPDEKWPEFASLASVTGHVKLAMTVTRMCELYLGLSEHNWCAQVDSTLCETLMEYILSCGNFGRKKETKSHTSEVLLTSASWKSMLIKLKQRGVLNWRTAQKYPFFRPLAAIYQMIRYVFDGLTRKNAIKKLREEIIISRRNSKLFESIGVARERSGRVTYHNGKYVNKQ